MPVVSALKLRGEYRGYESAHATQKEERSRRKITYIAKQVGSSQVF